MGERNVFTYRVRERDWSDLRCATVTASSPQHAAEVYVECRERPSLHGDEVEVVVIDEDDKRHNVVVSVRMSMSYDARKHRDMQKERW